MEKDPAFLFYAKDFYTSTALWSDDECGKFIRLLCLQHQTGHLKKADVERFCGIESRVLEKFKEDENGYYFNQMLEDEIKRREKISESRKIVAEAKWKKQTECNQNANVMQMQCKCTTNADANAMQIGTGTVNETVYVNETISKVEVVSEEEEMFNQFWSAYPKKVAKPQCKTAFRNIAHLKEQFQIIMAALEEQKQSKSWQKDHGQFIPNPLTWIHQERWNNVQEPTNEDYVRSLGLPF